MSDEYLTPAQYRRGVIAFTLLLIIEIGCIVLWAWLYNHPETTNCWAKQMTEQQAIQACEHHD